MFSQIAVLVVLILLNAYFAASEIAFISLNDAKIEKQAKVAGLSGRHPGRRNIFSPSAKIVLMVLKAYTEFSDRQLVEHLNGNIHC